MILLSICIPTYNHAAFLERMLARLTGLPAFSGGEVEIVISDNASVDGTREVGERFSMGNPQLVRYFRNNENVRDINFGLSLSRGRGTFLKLANDTLLFSNDGLTEMLSAVRRHLTERPVLFFSNQSMAEEVRCMSFDALFDEISFHSTWIGSFGVWKSDFDAMQDFSRASGLKLVQVDALCRMMSAKGVAVVNRVKFAESLPRGRIGGYNLAQVFGRNYFSILKEYAGTGMLSAAAFRREKYRMLRYHVLPFYLKSTACNGFPKNGYYRWLVHDYQASLLFWFTVPVVLIVEMFSWLLICKKKICESADNVCE